MRTNIKILLLTLILIPFVGLSQTITHSCKSTVKVGEQFQVSFEVNGDCKNFKGPNFDGFYIVAGPMSSSSSSIQIINGSMTRTTSTTYSYILRALKEGKFTIGEATANADKKKINSSPFEIEVVASNASTDSGSKKVSKSTKDELFLKAVANKADVYVGEQIILTYRIYSKTSITSMQISQKPSYGGFWTKNLTEGVGALQRSTELIDDEEYMVADIQTVALIPQKAGQLTIDPMEIECMVPVRQQRQTRSNDPFDIFFNDPFFNTTISSVNKFVSTEPIKVNVKPLPTDKRPASFGNAVGQFNIKSSIDKTELKANEAFTLTISVSGRGNIDLLEMPRPDFPPDFEVYEPKVTLDTKATNRNGVQGTKKAEYLVIPRAHGDFTIPSTEFSYFDPSKKAYCILSAPEYSLKVARDNSTSSSTDVAMAVNQEDIKYIGHDVQHIFTNNPKLQPVGKQFFASATYWVLIALLIVLFAVAMAVITKEERIRQDESLVRNRKANKMAIGRLKKARAAMLKRDQNTFYTEMAQALEGYISDKLSIERSKLSKDTISQMLAEKNVPSELIEQYVDALNFCEEARYAPGDAKEMMDDLYSKGLSVITKTEKQL